MAKDKDIPKSRSQRVMVGHIGVSASHIIDQHVVDTLADWEAVTKAVATGKFQNIILLPTSYAPALALRVEE